MKSDNRCIPLILGFSLFVTFCEADRKSYGDSCDKTNRCNSQSSISCIENKCQCLKPNEMIYDESVKKCLILSGEKCIFTLVDSQNDAFGDQRVTEAFDCVENAVCVGEYCSCSPEYYEDAQGICREKGTNGKNCTKDTECRGDLMLTCKDGFCLCNQSEAVFYGGECVGKAGFPCINNGQCVPNAECGYYDKLCTCKSGYKKSEDGLCLGLYGNSCDANDSPCTQQFSCIDKKCDCHYKQHQTYSDAHEQCVSYVQGPCFENVTGSVLRFPCVENAECKTRDGISECICTDGYINSYDRKCYTAHGQSCARSDSCDPLSALICKNGRCSCKDLHIYDEQRTLCIGLVGAECDLRSEYNYCVTGSTCKSYRFSSSEWLWKTPPYSGSGTCRCSESFMANSERKCDPKFTDHLENLYILST